MKLEDRFRKRGNCRFGNEMRFLSHLGQSARVDIEGRTSRMGEVFFQRSCENLLAFSMSKVERPTLLLPLHFAPI